jgi:hypothetical protein
MFPVLRDRPSGAVAALGAIGRVGRRRAREAADKTGLELTYWP